MLADLRYSQLAYDFPDVLHASPFREVLQPHIDRIIQECARTKLVRVVSSFSP